MSPCCVISGVLKEFLGVAAPAAHAVDSCHQIGVSRNGLLRLETFLGNLDPKMNGHRPPEGVTCDTERVENEVADVAARDWKALTNVL